MGLLQAQASTQEPLRNIMDNTRTVLSRVCLGIDDMPHEAERRL